MKKVVATNRKASYHYTILERMEAGIVLTGSEVKSLRNGNVDISDGYITVANGEVFMVNVHISPYFASSDKKYEPKRERKLLLKRREIDRLMGKIKTRGFTAIPLSIYFKDGKLAKVEIGLVKGKKMVDRREEIKRRDIEREMRRGER